MMSGFRIGDLVRERPGACDEWSDGLELGEVVNMNRAHVYVRFITNHRYPNRENLSWWIDPIYLVPVGGYSTPCSFMSSTIFN